MRIENGKTTYSYIQVGECFYVDDEMCMRVKGSEHVNAVSLETGRLYDYSYDLEVIRANAKVVVE